MLPPYAETTPSLRSTAPPATTPLLLPMIRVMSPLNGRRPGSAGCPALFEVNASHSPSNEKIGLPTFAGARPVTGRCVLSFSDAIHNWPPRVKAISLRSRERRKLPASRGLRAGRRRHGPQSTVLREQDLGWRHPRERTDVSDPDLGVHGEVRERDRGLTRRHDVQILLAPGVPQERDHLPVRRPCRRGRIFHARDAIDGEAAAGSLRIDWTG